VGGVKKKTQSEDPRFEKAPNRGHPRVGFVGYLEELEGRLAVVVPAKIKSKKTPGRPAFQIEPKTAERFALFAMPNV